MASVTQMNQNLKANNPDTKFDLIRALKVAFFASPLAVMVDIVLLMSR
jgi:hypothetical protein